MRGFLSLEAMVLLLAILAFASMFLQLIAKTGLEANAHAKKLDGRLFGNHLDKLPENVGASFQIGNRNERMDLGDDWGNWSENEGLFNNREENGSRGKNSYLPYHQIRITADSRSMK
ncbi:hypothetical protein HY989_03005 [Candidatus Micrarchaeota archaeon]|nr:hypothetical protein [Candidatus Micrarchaeota archaeon]